MIILYLYSGFNWWLIVLIIFFYLIFFMVKYIKMDVKLYFIIFCYCLLESFY